MCELGKAVEKADRCGVRHSFVEGAVQHHDCHVWEYHLGTLCSS